MSTFRCLLIDDDADDHEFFQMAIDRIDPSIVCHFANNGLSGLQLLNQLETPPNLIFVDLNMPMMGGMEFMLRLRNTAHSRIPVVIYSTTDERFFQQQGTQAGAAAYMVKTSTMEALEEGLRRIFQKFAQLP